MEQYINWCLDRDIDLCLDRYIDWCLDWYAYRCIGRHKISSTDTRYYLLIYWPILSTNIPTNTRYYLPIYRPILSTGISTDTGYYLSIYRPILYTNDRLLTYLSADMSIDTTAFIDRSSVGRVSTDGSTDMLTDINQHARWSIGKVSVKYRWTTKNIDR